MAKNLMQVFNNLYTNFPLFPMKRRQMEMQIVNVKNDEFYWELG